MGEYATRLSDDIRIKIGTCEDMFYLRYEDREKVGAIPGNVNPHDTEDLKVIRFRLPFPNEDDIPIGQYEDPHRGQMLYKQSENGCSEYFADAEAGEKHMGSFQMYHKSGLLFSVPCHHGAKLPDLGLIKVHWNGKAPALVLGAVGLRPHGGDGPLRVYPVIRCIFCGEMWRSNWAEIWEYIPHDIRPRFEQYAQDEFNCFAVRT